MFQSLVTGARGFCTLKPQFFRRMVWGRFKKISFTKSRPVVGGNEFQHHSGQTQVFQGGA